MLFVAVRRMPPRHGLAAAHRMACGDRRFLGAAHRRHGCLRKLALFCWSAGSYDFASRATRSMNSRIDVVTCFLIAVRLCADRIVAVKGNNPVGVKHRPAGPAACGAPHGLLRRRFARVRIRPRDILWISSPEITFEYSLGRRHHHLIRAPWRPRSATDTVQYRAVHGRGWQISRASANLRQARTEISS